MLSTKCVGESKSNKKHATRLKPIRMQKESTCSKSVTERRHSRTTMTNNSTRSDILSQIYHSLRAPRRRILIQVIARSDENTLSVRTCARHVTAVENGVQPRMATGEQYRNVYNALSQTHLSTLSDAGLVIYDADRQTVSAGPKLQLGMLMITLNRTTYRVLQGQYLSEIEDSNK